MDENMFVEAFIICLSIIVNGTNEEISKSQFVTYQPYLFWVAVELEIADMREQKWYFHNNSQLEFNLNSIHNKYEEFKHYPLLNEASLFDWCSKQDIQALLVFNREYRSILESKQLLSLVPYDKYVLAIKETDKLYEIWQFLIDVKTDYYYIGVKRKALQNLKNVIGEENYYQGHMPVHLPIWRLEQVK